MEAQAIETVVGEVHARVAALKQGLATHSAVIKNLGEQLAALTIEADKLRAERNASKLAVSSCYKELAAIRKAIRG